LNIASARRWLYAVQPQGGVAAIESSMTCIAFANGFMIDRIVGH
jgi:hypothetical protein